MNNSGHGTNAAGGEAGRRIGQRRGVPPLLHLPTWSRLLIATRQRSIAGRGGDFFEVVQHRDGSVSTFMADVCGNGPVAAAPVQGMRWVLRQRLAHGDPPGALLAALNDWLVAQRNDERFVTALCLRVDPLSGRADMAGAGHLGPFVKRAAGPVACVALSGGLALGILPVQSYQETTLELAPEDTIVLCTDGITDRMATRDDPLGAAGLIDHLARARHGAESICNALLGPEVPTGQDATVIVVQLPRRHRRATPGGRAAER
jgi:serine phosphatase RsbU (regulator of sigma subunit)